MANGMTTDQRSYAIRRIRDIASEMKAAVSKKYVKEHEKELTIGELVKLILNGTVKPKKENAHKLLGGGYQPHCINTLSEAFEIVDPSPYYRTNPVCDEAKMRPALASIEVKATRLTDKLMLSDAATALKVVEDFEKEAVALTKKSR